MTNIERINKYKQEHCINCLNKNEDESKGLCNIVIIRNKDMVYTKCCNYVKDDASICIKTKCRQCAYYNKCFSKGKVE